MVSYIYTLTELSKYTGDSDKLTVLYFTATWCEPCKQISPIFESLANPNVNFLKVNVSDGSRDSELATEYLNPRPLRVIPTFIFLKDKKVVHKIFGANSHELISSVAKFSTPASPGALSGKGHILSDEPLSDSSSELSYNLSDLIWLCVLVVVLLVLYVVDDFPWARKM